MSAEPPNGPSECHGGDTVEHDRAERKNLGNGEIFYHPEFEGEFQKKAPAPHRVDSAHHPFTFGVVEKTGLRRHFCLMFCQEPKNRLAAQARTDKEKSHKGRDVGFSDLECLGVGSHGREEKADKNGDQAHGGEEIGSAFPQDGNECVSAWNDGDGQESLVLAEAVLAAEILVHDPREQSVDKQIEKHSFPTTGSFTRQL